MSPRIKRSGLMNNPMINDVQRAFRVEAGTMEKTFSRG
jgi:hypothetical protein